MSKVFYFNEIVKFAIEKEEESIALYQRLAEQTEDSAAKQLFESLVAEEHKHEDFYRNMLESVAKEQTPKVTEDEEYDAYMKELIAESRQHLPAASLDTNIIDVALDYAIAREKDSVVFYAGLKNYVPQNMQSKVDAIIHEETKHAMMLVNLKKQLV